MYKLDVIKSTEDERDLVLSAPSSVIELPEEYDPYDYLFPVRDQGQEGSCSAHTAAAIKEWQEWHEGGIKIDMSTDFIYTKRGNPYAEGMTPKETMEILYKHGSLPRVMWQNKLSRRYDPKIAAIAAQFKISGYGKVDSIESLKNAIFSHGIGYFAIPVFNFSKKPWIQNPGDSNMGGHAITVVAWNKEGFVLRNSWGTNFGDNGYMLFPFEDWGKHWECWFVIDAETKKMLSMQKKVKRRANKSN